MSKFNNTNTIKTTNHEGHVAYSMSDKSRLVTQVLTSFFNEAKFYGDNSAEMEKNIQRVIKTDPQFVSNLAVFARREFNMRSVAHVLTAYLAHEPEGKKYVRDTINGITLRGDDATELMSFYLSKFGKPIPNSLRRGIEDVFGAFDEYTLAKYKGEGKGVKMRDLLCLCRPAPKDDAQSAMWKRLLEGKLEVPMTWETQLSANGNNRQTWEKLIDSGKVGYMALLRNLRNIVKACPQNIEKVWQTIENPLFVRRSKQLPFRFLSAYKSIQSIADSRALDALEAAAEASVENMEKLPGTTVIAVDVSGSMGSPISGKSQVRCAEVGMMLGVLASRICDNGIFYEFDNIIEKHPVSKHTGILYAAIREAKARGGTWMQLPFEKMMKDGVNADRIIIISDNECNSPWNGPVQKLADEYRRQSGNNLWVHAIDLQGYGTQQFHGPRTNIIAGWSEKVFQFIQYAEAGVGSIEKAIEGYTWIKRKAA